MKNRGILFANTQFQHETCWHGISWFSWSVEIIHFFMLSNYSPAYLEVVSMISFNWRYGWRFSLSIARASIIIQVRLFYLFKRPYDVRIVLLWVDILAPIKQAASSLPPSLSTPVHLNVHNHFRSHFVHSGLAHNRAQQ